jgi:hypothetical protein
MVIYIDTASPKVKKRLFGHLGKLHDKLCQKMLKAMPFEEFAKGKPHRRINNTVSRWIRILAEPYARVLTGQPLKVGVSDCTAKRVEEFWAAFWGMGEDILSNIMEEVREGKLNFSTLFNEQEKKDVAALIRHTQADMQATLEGLINQQVNASLRLVER